MHAEVKNVLGISILTNQVFSVLFCAQQDKAVIHK